MSTLVANPEDRFSHDGAHMYLEASLNNYFGSGAGLNVTFNRDEQ